MSTSTAEDDEVRLTLGRLPTASPTHLVDVKRLIAWPRTDGVEHGFDLFGQRRVGLVHWTS